MGSLLQVPPSLPKRSSDPACDKLSCRSFRDLQCIKKRHLLFLSWILFKVLYHTFKLLLCTAFWRHRLKHCFSNPSSYRDANHKRIKTTVFDKNTVEVQVYNIRSLMLWQNLQQASHLFILELFFMIELFKV